VRLFQLLRVLGIFGISLDSLFTLALRTKWFDRTIGALPM